MNTKRFHVIVNYTTIQNDLNDMEDRITNIH